MQYLRGITCIALLLQFCFPGIVRADDGATRASLDVIMDGVQPAGGPVLMTLSLRNTGNVPIGFWCGGPGDYPDAAGFTATVWRVGSRDAAKEFVLVNGQKSAGAQGMLHTVAPGRTLQFPAAMEPLDEGTYRLTITGQAEPNVPDGGVGALSCPATQVAGVLELKIVPGADVLAARDRKTIERIRANDPFWKYLAATWPRKTVRDALVKDLMGDNVVAADRAADGLWGDGDAAAADPEIVASAVEKHLHPPDGACDVGLMQKLLTTTRRTESPALNRALLRLVNTRHDGAVRERAVAALDRPADDGRGSFSPYHVRANDTDVLLRQQHDAAVVSSLIGLCQSADPKERILAVRMLSEFGGNADAIAALKRAQDDSDHVVAAAATSSLYKADPPPEKSPVTPPPAVTTP